MPTPALHAFAPLRNDATVPPPLSCRDGCGACCIAPSISSAIPGMPQGKPAGVRCVQLDELNRCKIFGQPQRPAVCSGLQPSQAMCGNSASEAMHWLQWLEAQTAPSQSPAPSAP